MNERKRLDTDTRRQVGAFRKVTMSARAAAPDHLLQVHPVPSTRHDILAVAMHFVRNFAVSRGKEPPALSEDAAGFLAARRWSAADLASRLARAVAVNGGSLLTAADLSDP